ncbi:multinuclear nonheme iron-dependent oxidase, partial [Pseudomonas sp.]|uniref:multinuclear nonheme iron-dependent oxidase n=1 Tax=Pseudomonas sp. TaxID=306 RepID=UPI003F98C799
MPMSLQSTPLHRAQAVVPGLPPRAGLGLKTEHFQVVLETRPDLGFFEVHAENYMVAGGPFHHYLGLIREQ